MSRPQNNSQEVTGEAKQGERPLGSKENMSPVLSVDLSNGSPAFSTQTALGCRAHRVSVKRFGASPKTVVRTG